MILKQLAKILSVKTIMHKNIESCCFSMEQFLRQPFSATHISPEQLYDKISRGEKMFILDVREPEEFWESGFIKGAVNIPVHEVVQKVKELPPDLDYPIIVVCESGSRSAFTVLYLSSCSYTDVKNLEYGLRGWRALGYPVAFT